MEAKNRLVVGLCVLLGGAAYAAVLACFNIADGDLWARLAAGAAVIHTGAPFPRDVFAFTPVLTEWIDHEWGAGVVFYSLLRWCGPLSLLWAKIIMALAALALALQTARRQGAHWPALLLLAIPCAWALLPGYIPVIRSHAFTYLFFAFALFAMEQLRNGGTWPVFAIPPVMLVWANVHGGFVAGLGVIGVYASGELLGRRAHAWRACLTLALAVGACAITPYGMRFWFYLLPALQHPRLRITEWGPLALWNWDVFTGARLVSAAAVLVLIAGWRRGAAAVPRSWPGLVLFALTAWLAWRHRRHAPFLGLTAAAVLPPYLQAIFERAAASRPAVARFFDLPKISVVLLYGIVGAVGIGLIWPRAELHVLAPVGYYPVREADILSQAGVSGHLAVPFRWGSYAAWRLYPRIRVSIDGRYEETYPETTFEMNERFFRKEGPDWTQLVRAQRVDFIITERARTDLTADDLEKLGYECVWSWPKSALWSRAEFAGELKAAAAALPDTTIDPLDASIAAAWFAPR
jgi:hypothetical protein